MNDKGIGAGVVKFLGLIQIAGGLAMLAQQYNFYNVPDIPFLNVIMASIMIFMALFTIKDSNDMRLPV